jgi:hypothetical protein
LCARHYQLLKIEERGGWRAVEAAREKAKTKSQTQEEGTARAEGSAGTSTPSGNTPKKKRRRQLDLGVGRSRGPVPPEQRLVKIRARVTREELARLKELDEGSVSLGIQVALNSSWFEDEN